MPRLAPAAPACPPAHQAHASNHPPHLCAVTVGERFVYRLSASVREKDVANALLVDVFPQGLQPLAVSPQTFCELDSVNQQVGRVVGEP